MSLHLAHGYDRTRPERLAAAPGTPLPIGGLDSMGAKTGVAAGSGNTMSAGVAGGSNEGGNSALAQALDRWRRVLRPDVWDRPAPTVAAAPAADTETVAALARRLDDSGCSYGRVSAAKLEHMIRAYDRLETKLNAVLMAVTGTFLSTLAGLLLYYVRGGSQ
jgi:hypothetical protein